MQVHSKCFSLLKSIFSSIFIRGVIRGEGVGEEGRRKRAHHRHSTQDGRAGKRLAGRARPEDLHVYFWFSTSIAIPRLPEKCSDGRVLSRTARGGVSRGAVGPQWRWPHGMGRVSTTGVNGPLRYIKGTKGAGAALRNCHCDWVFHESERPHSR